MLCPHGLMFVDTCTFARFLLRVLRGQEGLYRKPPREAISRMLYSNWVVKVQPSCSQMPTCKCYLYIDKPVPADIAYTVTKLPRRSPSRCGITQASLSYTTHYTTSSLSHAQVPCQQVRSAWLRLAYTFIIAYWRHFCRSTEALFKL